MNESRSLLGYLRTFVIVSLITIMVWLLAEARMVQTQTLEAQVFLTSVDGAGGVSLVVRQAPNISQVRTISIQVEGSIAGLDRFARVLQNSVELRVGRDIPAQPGTHTLDLRTLLRQSSNLDVHGLTITQVSPESIVVEVDELETRDFPIRVIMPAGVELDGAPRSEPASVRVVAPSTVLAQVLVNEATVRVDASEVTLLTQGRLETIPGVVVNIEGLSRGDWATTIEPAQVDVFVSLRTLTQTLTLSRMPVQVLLAPGEIGDWHVQINDSDKDLVGVEVTGPADAINLLKSGAVVPKAFVTLSFEDLERRVQSKPAQVQGLPPGCRVVSPEKMVNLEILPVVNAVQSPVGTPVQPVSTPSTDQPADSSSPDPSI